MKTIHEILRDITDEDIYHFYSEPYRQEIIDEFQGRFIVNGKDEIKSLVKILYLSSQDALDNRIYDALELVESDAIVTKILVSRILVDATNQGKYKAFEEKRKALIKIRHQAKVEEEKELSNKDLTIDVIKDILSELDIIVCDNLITKRTEIKGKGADDLIYSKYSKSKAETVLVDILQNECRKRKIVGCKGNSGVNAIEDKLFIIADENRYNPVIDILKTNINDNVENLNKVLNVLHLKSDFEKKLFVKWLIQTVAITHNNEREEPISAEGVLTLRGDQAAGKTSFCRKLALNTEWFVEGAVLDLNNKDSIITALSGFITELGEIDATFKKKQSQLKAFFTRTMDRIRFPFGRRDSTIPRTTSFCATVNPEKFLKDDTGNRRYWIIEVSDIDKGALFKLNKHDFELLWGYIYNLYLKEPDSYRLNYKELNQLNDLNLLFMEKYPYEDEVRELFDLTVPTDTWVWYSPTKISKVIQYKNANAEKVGKVLSKMEKEDARIKKRRQSNCVQYLLPPIDKCLQGYF